MAIRGIIFDKDGTLLDFYSTWIPAYQAAARLVCQHAGRPERSLEILESTGLEIDTSRLIPGSPLTCESNSRIAQLWATLVGLPDEQEVLMILESTFDTQGAARAVPIPDLVPLLARLRRQGYTLGLATMDSEALAHATLTRFKANDYFSFVCGYDSGYGHKPDPGMIRGFCAATSLQPEECVMVGDTPHDLHMGIAAGVSITVGVLTGAGDRESLAEFADHVVADIHGLESILDNIRSASWSDL